MKTKMRKCAKKLCCYICFPHANKHLTWSVFVVSYRKALLLCELTVCNVIMLLINLHGNFETIENNTKENCLCGWLQATSTARANGNTKA